MGDIDNFRMFLEDLAAVNNIPESTIAYIDIYGLLSWLGNNRGVDYSSFIKSREEYQKEQQAIIQQQQEMQAAEAATSMAATAGTEIAKQTE